MEKILNWYVFSRFPTQSKSTFMSSGSPICKVGSSPVSQECLEQICSNRTWERLARLTSHNYCWANWPCLRRARARSVP